MSGSALVAELLKRDEAWKVIYASGYSAEMASKSEHLHEGVNFLAKPFTPDRLTTIVRQALDSTSKAVDLAKAR